MVQILKRACLWTAFIILTAVTFAPAASLIDLTKQVKGILPLANGGTGVTSAQGNGSKVQLSTGSTTTNNCVKYDANGNTVDAGISCSASGAPTNATYVTCTSNGSLSANTIFFDLCNSPDIPPGSANAMDDEMNAGAGGVNLGLWTWVNQGTTTANYSGTGFLTVVAPAAGTTSLRMLEQSLPSAPYAFTAKVECQGIAEDYHDCGIFLRESGTSKIVYIYLDYGVTGVGAPSDIAVDAYTNSTTFSAHIYGPTTTSVTGAYFRVARSGTTLTFQYSTEGTVFQTVVTEAITAHFTTAPDQVGVVAGNRNGSNTVNANFWWFRRTT